MKDFDNYIKTLSKLISIKSTYSCPQEDAPFGVENKNALLCFLNVAKDMGFETINYDNYAGEIVFGNGREVGIIGHLDVVPVGIGWNTDPWTLTEINGTYYGRGVQDDKAPLLSCLYALKELKDSDINSKVKFRLFIGCDEETGWRDLAYLNTKTTLPEYGFSPDGNFPLSYAEKGIIEAIFTLPKLKHFHGTKGGTVINAVCDYASVVADDGFIDKQLLKKYNLSVKNNNVIESFGKAAHGSTPHLGVNAIKPLLSYMRDMGEDLDGAISCLFEDKFKIGNMTTEQGAVTLSPDIIFEKDNLTVIACDCRIPAPLTVEQVTDKFSAFNLDYKIKIRHEPVMVEKEGLFVKTLLCAHDSVTGKTSQPISQGGSTFSRAFKKGCAFGPEFSGYENKIHDANENETKEHLLTAYKIYKKAIFSLAQNFN